MHIKFKGDGSAEIIGIPARDLSESDWNELTDSQRAHALASGLYEVVAPAASPVQVEAVKPTVKKNNAPDSGKEAN